MNVKFLSIARFIVYQRKQTAKNIERSHTMAHFYSPRCCVPLRPRHMLLFFPSHFPFKSAGFWKSNWFLSTSVFCQIKQRGQFSLFVFFRFSFGLSSSLLLAHAAFSENLLRDTIRSWHAFHKQANCLISQTGVRVGRGGGGGGPS